MIKGYRSPAGFCVSAPVIWLWNVVRSFHKVVNKSWSMHFMRDSMEGGRMLRTFNVMDDCTREALAIEASISLSSKRGTRILNRVVDMHEKNRL